MLVVRQFVLYLPVVKRIPEMTAAWISDSSRFCSGPGVQSPGGFYGAGGEAVLRESQVTELPVSWQGLGSSCGTFTLPVVLPLCPLTPLLIFL